MCVWEVCATGTSSERLQSENQTHATPKTQNKTTNHIIFHSCHKLPVKEGSHHKGMSTAENEKSEQHQFNVHVHTTTICNKDLTETSSKR